MLTGKWAKNSLKSYFEGCVLPVNNQSATEEEEVVILG